MNSKLEHLNKLLPDLNIKVDATLNNAKRDPNSKKIRDIKKVLGKVVLPQSI